MIRRIITGGILLLWSGLPLAANAQLRGSIIEDRAARKLVEAGDARLDANEAEKALEIWKSVLERYPRSKVRFDAHLRLGDYMLRKNNAYDRARVHFDSAAKEENSDDEQRAEATLKSGICFYEARLYSKCFKIMRQVIEIFPASEFVNKAYYYIGLGHFKLGHYSRAIDALEKVGTAFSADDKSVEKVEAGKRLFVRIDDTDLAILDEGETVTVTCTTNHKDVEEVECIPVGRNIRVVLGSIPTVLGRPIPNNGVLEIRGGDQVKVNYTDAHTADRKFNQTRIKTIQVVGNAVVQITDGAFQETLNGVVLGKPVNLQLTDADFDVSDGIDSVKATVEIYRAKTPEEVEEEVADLVAKGEIDVGEDDEAPKVDPYKRVDGREIVLKELEPATVEDAPRAPAPVEAVPPVDSAAAPPADSDFLKEVKQAVKDDSIHTGIFRASIPLAKEGDKNAYGDGLKARPSDVLRITFVDELNVSPKPVTVKAEARCIEGNLGGVRVTRTEIADEGLRIQTKLKTASALTSIGNHYREFGLDDKAQLKYDEALQVCDEITDDARALGGQILEETYVQLWRVYFAMDNLKLAMAMCQRLMRDFPGSAFVDEAMLQQGYVAQKRGDLGRAINLFSSVTKLKDSSLRGEGQYGVAECYEQMASKEAGPKAESLFDRAFQEYKKVFEQYPESGKVGDAVAKMANFYYQKKDYARAVDVFENVLSDHPDANFLDVILFNYGRCLYRLNKKKQARVQFDQLIGDFPESALAAEAKRISEVLIQGGF